MARAKKPAIPYLAYYSIFFAWLQEYLWFLALGVQDAQIDKYDAGNHDKEDGEQHWDKAGFVVI